MRIIAMALTSIILALTSGCADPKWANVYSGMYVGPVYELND